MVYVNMSQEWQWWVSLSLFKQSSIPSVAFDELVPTLRFRRPTFEQRLRPKHNGWDDLAECRAE